MQAVRRCIGGILSNLGNYFSWRNKRAVQKRKKGKPDLSHSGMQKNESINRVLRMTLCFNQKYSNQAGLVLEGKRNKKKNSSLLWFQNKNFEKSSLIF